MSTDQPFVSTEQAPSADSCSLSMLARLECELQQVLAELVRLQAENAQLRLQLAGCTPRAAPVEESPASDQTSDRSDAPKAIGNTTVNTPKTGAAEQARTPARKSKNRSANRAAIDLLAQHYPAAFNLEQVRPLKIGIQEDLLADDKLPKGKIKRALASYVRTVPYLKSLQSGAVRVDLQGQPAGEVSEQEAEHARGMLKKWRKERQAREKQAQEKERQDRMQNKLSQLLERSTS